MYILWRKTHDVLVGASKDIWLEVNADKTKHIVMSQDQNAGQSQNMRLIIIPLKGWNSSNIWEQP